MMHVFRVLTKNKSKQNKSIIQKPDADMHKVLKMDPDHPDHPDPEPEIG